MSMVVDQLEETVLEALPGETDKENAEYLRDLIRRLDRYASGLDGVRVLTRAYDTDDAAKALSRAQRPSEADTVARTLDGIGESAFQDAVRDAAGDNL